MKHYLDLIKISAKRHRKQNRMTRLCIVLAVFLVTVIFGMADMEMRSQYIQAIKTDGSWHAAFAMEDEQGALLRERPEVEEIARYGTLNYHLEDGYQLGGVETGICGFDRKCFRMRRLRRERFLKMPRRSLLMKTQWNSWRCRLGKLWI